MTNGFFITGTDTDVGKSYFGSLLVAYLYKQGRKVQPRKPIESGCTLQNNQLIPNDGLAYHKATNKEVPLDIITPYRYEPALAPLHAMSKKNSINLQQLTEAVYQDYNQEELLIVEGAGGFYSPLCIDASNADLARAIQLPIVLIVGNKVGCINHCLLTVEAIVNKSLSIAAIIINDNQQNNNLLDKNYTSIKGLLKEYDPFLQDRIFSMQYKSQFPVEFAQIIT